MNKEQRKFKKVIKARRIRQAYKRSITDKFGVRLPIDKQPKYKSKKYKLKKVKNGDTISS